LPLQIFDLKVSVKCEPEKAIDLRNRYLYVHPGYHMSKKHWNTIDIYLAQDDKLIQSWINDSYKLVVNSLSKKLQAELAAIES